MTETRIEEGSVWKSGFLFVGNHLALDFLNTRPVQDGQAMELLPDFAALLRWFQAAGLLSPREVAALDRQWGQSAVARRTLEDLLGLRERLRKAVLAWEEGHIVQDSTIDELNRWMAAYPMRDRLKKRNGEELSAESYFKPQSPEDLFAPLAQAAAMLFANTNRDRVRKCDQCVLHFVDTSKKGTRRWCSMQLCGNRLKVAAYAARQRSASVKG
jgi:predicted RNA-binding Zn ribbon-like protein